MIPDTTALSLKRVEGVQELQARSQGATANATSTGTVRNESWWVCEVNKTKDEGPGPRTRKNTTAIKAEIPDEVLQARRLQQVAALRRTRANIKSNFRFRLSVNALAVGSAVAPPDGRMRSNPKRQSIHEQIILVLLGPNFICERRPQLGS